MLSINVNFIRITLVMMEKLGATNRKQFSNQLFTEMKIVIVATVLKSLFFFYKISLP